MTGRSKRNKRQVRVLVEKGCEGGIDWVYVFKSDSDRLRFQSNPEQANYRTAVLVNVAGVDKDGNIIIEEIDKY